MSKIDIKRKKGETFEAMFRRFTRRVQESGKVLDVKGGRFFERKPNRNRRRDSAIRRIELGVKREYLLKTGKITEEDLRKPHKR